MPGLLLMTAKCAEQKIHIAVLEVVSALLHFVLMKYVAVADTRCIDQIKHVIYALQIHGQTLQTIGDLTGDRFAVNAAYLLEVSELCDFHAVQPYLPAQTPGTQRRVFPVVLYESDVIGLQIKAYGLQ